MYDKSVYISFEMFEPYTHVPDFLDLSTFPIHPPYTQ